MDEKSLEEIEAEVAAGDFEEPVETRSHDAASESVAEGFERFEEFKKNQKKLHDAIHGTDKARKAEVEFIATLAVQLGAGAYSNPALSIGGMPTAEILVNSVVAIMEAASKHVNPTSEHEGEKTDG